MDSEKCEPGFCEECIGCPTSLICVTELPMIITGGGFIRTAGEVFVTGENLDYCPFIGDESLWDLRGKRR